MAISTTGNGRTSTLVRVEYKDKQGRLFAVLLPDGSDSADAHKGIVIGPPELDSLIYLPKKLQVEIHNELYSRGLLTASDVRRKRDEVKLAVLSALRHSVVDDILEVFNNESSRTV